MNGSQCKVLTRISAQTSVCVCVCVCVCVNAYLFLLYYEDVCNRRVGKFLEGKDIF